MSEPNNSDDSKILIPAGSGITYMQTGPLDPAPTSMMRIMCFVSLAIGGTIAVWGMLRSEDLSQLAILAGVFVTPAFIGKVAQKHFETRGGDK